MNFSQVKAITIPEGAVKQITDGLGRVLWGSGPIVDYTIPLYIEAPADTPNPSGWDISLPSSNVSHWAGTRHIEYSFDRVTWTSVTLQNDSYNSYTNPVCHIDKGQKVYLRGSNTSWSSGQYNNFRLKIVSAGHFNGIKVGGNIMSIFYGENFTGEERSFPTGTYAITPLARFFSADYDSDRSAISDVSELLLPATTLTGGCYFGLFSNRNSITTTPTLPATTLADYCYTYMFSGCTSLTSAPELPVTTLAPYCYGGMFSGCTSLTQTPVLPATTLSQSCYSQMFYGCSSLTTAPALPATTLAQNCYEQMFYGCSSLTTTPVLPATTLAQNCYSYMFYDCISLTTAPALPATTLASYCYQYMFHNCGSLTQAPELPATTLVNGCYQGMFEWCSDINYIKCLATEDENYTYDFRTYCKDWVDGVSYSGTFIASDNYYTGWYWGKDGVPENWTTETESGNYFEPAQGGGSGSQIYQSNGLTIYEMGSEQGGYQVEANGSLMMVPGFDGNDYCFAMMKISNDQSGFGDAPMTPYLGNGVTTYISYEVMDDGTCPFSYSYDDEYDNYEYSLHDGDDGTQISPFIGSGNCRWVKFIKNQGTYEYNTPYISMGF